jgi:hypothetical protein
MGREVFRVLEILEASYYKKYDDVVTLIDILNKSFDTQLITTAVFKFSVHSKDLMDIYINNKLHNEKELPGFYHSIDEAVEALLKAKANGEYAYVVFNDVILHSDTVTIDSAYKEITGYNKDEYDRAVKAETEMYHKEYQQKHAQALSKKDDLIAEGKKYIKPELSDSWAKLVEARLDGIWLGSDIEEAIKIMAALDNNEIDKAMELYDSIDSGTAYYFVGQIVRSYSTKAKEFDDAVNEYENNKQVNTPVEETALVGYGIHTLEDAVNKLLAAKERGEHVYYNFNGHILHSDTVTMDSAYNEVLGYSKAEHDARQKKIYEIRAQQKEDAKKNVINWIVKGQGYIYPELFPKWIKCVNDRVEDLYLGSDLDTSLEIMKALDEDDMKTALKIFNDIDSGNAASMVMYIVLEFSKKGPEFVEAAYNHEVPEELLENVNTKKEENEIYAKIDSFTKK